MGTLLQRGIVLERAGAELKLWLTFEQCVQTVQVRFQTAAQQNGLFVGNIVELNERREVCNIYTLPEVRHLTNTNREQIQVLCVICIIKICNIIF